RQEGGRLSIVRERETSRVNISHSHLLYLVDRAGAGINGGGPWQGRHSGERPAIVAKGRELRITRDGSWSNGSSARPIFKNEGDNIGSDINQGGELAVNIPAINRRAIAGDNAIVQHQRVPLVEYAPTAGTSVVARERALR